MVFNATFNNISVISWQSVLLVEETAVRTENDRPAASHWQTLWHNVVSSTPRLSWIQTHNYHTITTTTTPSLTSIQWCFITSNSQLPYNHDYNNPLLNKYTMVFYHILLEKMKRKQIRVLKYCSRLWFTAFLPVIWGILQSTNV
jgi:hypothetical protein